MKNIFSILSLIITYISSLFFAINIILSEVLFPEINEFSLFPTYYKVLFILSLILIVTSFMLTSIFRNKGNTKILDLYIEIPSIAVGIVLLSCALLRTENYIKSILIDIGLILFVSGFNCLFSSLIGLLKRPKNR